VLSLSSGAVSCPNANGNLPALSTLSEELPPLLGGFADSTVRLVLVTEARAWNDLFEGTRAGKLHETGRSTGDLKPEGTEGASRYV